jgi:6-phosphogluconolactonase
MQPAIRIVADRAGLALAAAEEFARRCRATEGPPFSVALSGGSTPKALYSLLSEPQWSSLPWERVHLFWGDERFVPPDHPESNFRMVQEALLSKGRILESHAHRVKTELGDPARVAEAYEAEVSGFFGLRPGELPRFDLVFLGLGTDGHTASLFPGTPALEEKGHLVVANWVEKLGVERITLTLPVFNNAACIIFLVAGADKSEVLRAVQSGGETAALPASLVRPTDGELLWLVDRSAARLLPPRLLGGQA